LFPGVWDAESRASAARGRDNGQFSDRWASSQSVSYIEAQWVCSSRASLLVTGLAGSVGLASSWAVVVGGMTLLAYFT
jgi:hypothetical protein